MFQMAPEDRLREVLRYQEQQRAQMARERMARAAPAKRATEPSGARAAGSHNPWTVARQLLHSLAGTHATAHRTTAR